MPDIETAPIATEPIPETQPEVRNYGYGQSGDDISSLPPVETTPAKEPKPAEPANTEPKAPEAKTEPTIETKPGEQIPETKPTEVTAADWKAVLKSNNPDKYEVLKELGYDDWTIDMIKYKDKMGDLTPYLEVKTVDYAKMNPEQLVKLKIQRDNKGMNERALNFKVNKELNEKYFLNRDDYPAESEEAIYGQEQLRLDGEAERKAFTEEQSKFKAPEPQPDLDATKREADLQRTRAAIGETVMNNPITKSFLTDKAIKFGEGEESFTYKSEDAKDVVDLALNTIMNSGVTDLSKLNMDDFIKNLVIGRHKKEIFKGFYDAGATNEKERIQNELHNITPPEGNGQPAVPQPQKNYGYHQK